MSESGMYMSQNYEGIDVFCTAKFCTEELSVSDGNAGEHAKTNESNSIIDAIKEELTSDADVSKLSLSTKEPSEKNAGEDARTTNGSSITLVKKEVQQTPVKAVEAIQTISTPTAIINSVKTEHKTIDYNKDTDKKVNEVLEARKLLSQESVKNDARYVVIIWEVSYGVNINYISAQSFLNKNILPLNTATKDSVRRGLHDIFDLNLGFQTMNSLSALCVSMPVLKHILGVNVDIDDDSLMTALRVRIDLLVAFGLTSLSYIDFHRAALWLSGIINEGVDQALLFPRTTSAPFTMFIATRTKAFNDAIWP
jgi:hypothetical protein